MTMTTTYLQDATIRYLRDLEPDEVPTGAGLRAFMDMVQVAGEPAPPVLTDDELADHVDDALAQRAAADELTDTAPDDVPVVRLADDPALVNTGLRARMSEAVDAVDEAWGYLSANQSAVSQRVFVPVFNVLTRAAQLLADAQDRVVASDD